MIRYNYTVSVDDIRKAARAGYSVSIIINGEYYDFFEKEEKPVKNPENNKNGGKK